MQFNVQEIEAMVPKYASHILKECKSSFTKQNTRHRPKKKYTKKCNSMFKKCKPRSLKMQAKHKKECKSSFKKIKVTDQKLSSTKKKMQVTVQKEYEASSKKIQFIQQKVQVKVQQVQVKVPIT